jgi:hypothetical protein
MADKPNANQPAGATGTGLTENKNSTQGEGENSKIGWATFLQPQVFGSLGIAIVGFSLGWFIINGLSKPDSIVRQLGNADLARGVITFIFATGTIGIALLVALGALIGDKDDARLAKAKDVLTVLIGIFGTILGFYFGTANGNAQKLEIADIKFVGPELRTHVAGGTPPYRYAISFSEKDFKPIKEQITTDGWIEKPIDPKPTKGKITVDVTDSRDLKGSRDLTLSAASPSPSPSPTATATATAGTQASPSPTPPKS